jgi:hypothetical protein
LNQRAWLAAFLVAIAVQCVLLYIPRTPSVDSGLPIDKVVHVAMFAAVAATGVRAGVDVRILVVALVAQAVLSEVIQWALLPGRGGDPVDAMADLAGIAVGVALGRWGLKAKAGAR